MAENKKTVNTVAAGLAGAVVGAAAAAGAIILADEKNRQKLEATLNKLKQEGFKVMEIMQKEAAEIKKIATSGNSASEKKTITKKSSK